MGQYKDALYPVTFGHMLLVYLAQISCSLSMTENYLLREMDVVLFGFL